MMKIKFTLNKSVINANVSPGMTLLEYLRDEAGLTGAKNSCGGEGECGACTVIMDREAVNSCLVLMGQMDGHEVVTIEGLSKDGRLHPIQQAFISAGAVQCGFCTPGAVLSTKALLDKVPDPSEDEIREALSGNLCRCTGYSKMITAVQTASREISHAK
jgi:aerobic-type carbon monoxide dehydrogenase small subunit (CoxS/CutS family)